MNREIELLESVYIHTFVRILLFNLKNTLPINHTRAPRDLPVSCDVECQCQRNLIAVEKYVLFYVIYPVIIRSALSKLISCFYKIICYLLLLSHKERWKD